MFLNSLVFLFALEFVEIVIVVLHSEDFFFDNFDFVLRLEFVLIFVKGRDEVLVDDGMEFDSVDGG